MTAALRSGRLVVAALCVSMALSAGAWAQDAALERGAVLYAAGGCANCHTDVRNKGPEAAGGRAIETPFGTFYSPNITPDREHGIGSWSDEDFIRAMREGVSPDGAHYFPAFPYPAFTAMTDADLKALKAHIFTLKPVAKPDREHDLPFPFRLRFLQIGWKLLFFEEGPYQPDPARSAEWNRGAYLAEAVAHCGQCHTPRNAFGAVDESRKYAGAENGPEGEAVPNITPDPESGIGEWSEDDIVTYLGLGLTPSGDYAGSLMAEVIENGTDKLSDADRKAIAVYLRSIPPIRGKPRE